jgi:hypothetical protein
MFFFGPAVRISIKRPLRRTLVQDFAIEQLQKKGCKYS